MCDTSYTYNMTHIKPINLVKYITVPTQGTINGTLEGMQAAETVTDTMTDNMKDNATDNVEDNATDNVEDNVKDNAGNADDADCCPICLGTFEETPNETVIKLDCDHMFHTKCIQQTHHHTCGMTPPFVRSLKIGRPHHPKSYQFSMSISSDKYLKCPMCRCEHTFINDESHWALHQPTSQWVFHTRPKKVLGRIWFREPNTVHRFADYHHNITCEADIAHYFSKEDHMRYKRGQMDQLHSYTKYQLRLFRVFLERSEMHPTDNTFIPHNCEDHREFHALRCICMSGNPAMKQHCKRGSQCPGIILHPSYMCWACRGIVPHNMHATLDEVFLSVMGFCEPPVKKSFP
jgi:hypothetical protein